MQLSPEEIEAMKDRWRDAVVHLEKEYGRVLDDIDIDDVRHYDDWRKILVLKDMAKLLFPDAE